MKIIYNLTFICIWSSCTYSISIIISNTLLLKTESLLVTSFPFLSFLKVWQLYWKMIIKKKSHPESVPFWMHVIVTISDWFLSFQCIEEGPLLPFVSMGFNTAPYDSGTELSASPWTFLQLNYDQSEGLNMWFTFMRYISLWNVNMCITCVTKHVHWICKQKDRGVIASLLCATQRHHRWDTDQPFSILLPCFSTGCT